MKFTIDGFNEIHAWRFREINDWRFSWNSRLAISWNSRLTVLMKFTLGDFMKLTIDGFHEIHAWRFHEIHDWRFSWNSRLTVFMKFTIDGFHEIHAWRFHEIRARWTTSSHNIYTRFPEDTAKHLAADVSSRTDGRTDGWSRRVNILFLAPFPNFAKSG